MYRKKITGCWHGVRVGKELSTKGCEETFWGVGNVLCLGCSCLYDVMYLSQLTEQDTKMNIIVANYTSINLTLKK